jgi:bacteriocin biosynthesis cyclodehydratase domain-containing protein
MLRRPRFQPHLRVEVVPGEGVFLLSELTQTVLQGRLYEQVAPCLDGRPTEEIVGGLCPQLAPAQVFYTLAQLEQKGYLTESDDVLDADQAAWWTEQQVRPTEAAERLVTTAVEVQTLGTVDAGPLCALLQSLRVRLDGEAQFTVVVTDSYLRGDLDRVNAAALRDGRPWLLVKPIGRQLWLGPLFRPGKTGCWSCLAERLRANVPVLGYLDGKHSHGPLPTPSRVQTPATLHIAWGLTATAVTSWIARGELPHLEGKIHTLDVLTAKTQSHTLVRLPACQACGWHDSAPLELAPLVLQSCKKTFTKDGGHRVQSPEQTLERYGHHVSPITGAVSMLERDGAVGEGEGNGNGVIHVYLSGHNVARRARSLGALRKDLRSSNCGKGTSDAQARASALCEGLERYSAVFRGDEPRRAARLTDLGDAGIHPNACMLYSERQYRERNAWNARASSFDEVPLPFDAEAMLEWTPVWSLSKQTVRYLPTAFCYFNYPRPHGRADCFSCSNGNAAGNTREEAVLQGFLELVERDSVALWWYNRVCRPGVALESFDEPYVAQLTAFLRQHHRELWVLDLTSDLGIPVFAAVSRRTDGGAEQILFGFGAHLDARIAVLRAVTELNQMLSPELYAPAGALPGAQLSDPATIHWLRTATLADQPYLVPLPGPLRPASCYPPCLTDDLRDDVLFCQGLVERHGLEMLVLDQTRPEIGLPVVKVLVPGLRHFWPRFAPGRLYDVPVRLGWLPQALAEEQLNPVSMFL